MSKFKIKTGELSGYAFLCGYVERHEANGYRAEMYLEYGHFHVKKLLIQNGSRQTLEWHVYESNELAKARKTYRQHRTDINKAK